MRGVLTIVALAATACGGPAAREPDGSAHASAGNAAAPALAPADTMISYSVEGPGIGGTWRIGSDGKGSFDESIGDVLGRFHHLAARIDVGPAGFAEIERLVARLPAGEPPHCIDTLESMVAMGWQKLVRQGSDHRVESRFNLNCADYGGDERLVRQMVAADDRMRSWAEQAPGHEGSMKALYGNETQ